MFCNRCSGKLDTVFNDLCSACYTHDLQMLANEFTAQARVIKVSVPAEETIDVEAEAEYYKYGTVRTYH